MNLKDKVVIVTGASSGIGKELAFQLARQGAKVVLAARRMALLIEIEDKILSEGGTVFSIPTDVSRKFDVENLVRRTVQKFERLDIFISNAGISHTDLNAMDLKEAEVRSVMEINFMSAVYITWAAVPELEKTKGQLVFVSSIVGKRGIPKNSIYCASKFALNGYAESLRLELKKKEIAVTTICPPGVDTPFFEVNKRSTRKSFSLHPVDKIARLIISACENRAREELLTWDSKLLHWGNVLFPGLSDWAIAKNKGSMK